MIRWNPVREITRMQRDLDRMFDSVYDNGGSSVSNWGLPLDVTETVDQFQIVASVPGMNIDDLDITFADNVLTIRGEYKFEEEVEGTKYHIRERRVGSFARSINLPVMVNADEIDADYTDGVLTLTVPKAEEVKPRRIQIKAHSNGKQQVIEG
jgi:HSP20 family protein